MGENLMFISASSCVYICILGVGRPNFTFVVLKIEKRFLKPPKLCQIFPMALPVPYVGFFCTVGEFDFCG